MKNIDTKWFFSDLHWFFKILLIFVKGDLIVLLPFVILILLLGLLSIKWMVIMIGVYITVRYFGEMVYWLLQQFHDRKYRPYDFGLKNLDNHAIYILYQTFATAGACVGIGIVIGAIMYIK